MKCRDNRLVKEYWLKIKEVSQEVDIVPFGIFERTYMDPQSEVLFLDGAIFRISNIVRGHKAELHGYIFSHESLGQIKKFQYMLDVVCDRYSLHRVECVVDKNNKGLQRLLKVVQFKNEGIRENGVFLNGLCIEGIGYAYIR